ncbi:MAG: hypothetical protein PHO79_05250 [Desulfoplanes sp.]|nr:hypothetical protein [Desulfoplanes sp.]MDD4649408.1 hypothetical protein [Desulfoplanes sp.]
MLVLTDIAPTRPVFAARGSEKGPLNLALIQMNSVPDWSTNLKMVDGLLSSCHGCDLAVLPENVLCLGTGTTVRAAARPLDVLKYEIGTLAARHGLHVLFGGVPVVHGSEIRNAALVYSPDGQLVARYDKVHLFQLDPHRTGGVDETRVYSAGEGPVVWEHRGWRICLSICYDIRFPELFRACVPVDLILCSMAFTMRTGKAHGQLLLRTRAVENQCYALSSSQCGTNIQTGMQLFGHSMAVDPWGTVLEDAGPDVQGVVRVHCRRTVLEKVRETLPALRNIRLAGSKKVRMYP